MAELRSIHMGTRAAPLGLRRTSSCFCLWVGSSVRKRRAGWTKPASLFSPGYSMRLLLRIAWADLHRGADFPTMMSRMTIELQWSPRISSVELIGQPERISFVTLVSFTLCYPLLAFCGESEV